MESLLLFTGKAIESTVTVRTDCAPDLLAGIRSLQWIPETSYAGDVMHNTRVERLIRTVKEGARTLLLQSGLHHCFWPNALKYVCTVDSFQQMSLADNSKTKYEHVTGKPFTGEQIPFGTLVYYKPTDHRNLPPFQPRAIPGIFVG